MNEENTRELPDRSSFEQRVFARFDSIDERLERLEARNYDTKPIWERALAAIMETGLEVGEIRTKVGVIEQKVGIIEGKVGVIEGKVQTIENEIGVVKTDQRTMRNELVDVRRGLKHQIGERLDTILKLQLEDREDIRDAEGRIRELESKIA